MGVFDKIKNALFEEEYVEIEEKPKKPKKSKIKEKKNKEEETPIAKKVVLPEKKEKIETLEEEELDSNDYEFRPKDDIDKNELLEKRRDFKILDDDDLLVDDEGITDDGEELKIIPVVEEKVEEPKRDEIEIIGNDNYKINDNDFPFKDKDDRFNVNDYSNTSWNDNYKEKKSYVDDLNNSTEELKNDYSYPPPTTSRGLYGIDNSTKITMHEYGTYERKEEKSYFKPSPIISPIYGILDKNYKKEDVVQKREVKMSNSFERDKVSIDDIRKKAYGTLTDDFEDEFKDTDESVPEVQEEEENLLVDLNDEKPTVKEVTMGDAVEYFEDLGLEYNVDYVDDSKKQVVNEVVEEPKIEEVPKKEEKPVKVEKKQEKKEEKEKKEEEIPTEEPEVKVVPERLDKEEESVEEKEEELSKTKDDDNLFDLIDSMYQE